MTGPGCRSLVLRLLAATMLVAIPRAGQGMEPLQSQFIAACEGLMARNDPVPDVPYRRQQCTCKYQVLEQRVSRDQLEDVAQAYRSGDWGTVETELDRMDIVVGDDCVPQTRPDGT